MVEESKGMTRAAPWIGLAALLAVTALAYAPSLDGGFVLDDDRVVTWNPELRRPDALLLPGLPQMVGTGRPLTSVTFAADLRAASLDPRRFHLTGLLLHLAAVVVALVFLRRLLARVGHPRSGGVALVATALFALHPIQVESVAYVSQRSEVLSSILYLATLLLLDVAIRRWRSWGGLVAWLGGIGTWILAMGAKAIAISLPGAFVLDQLVLAPSGERGGRPAAWRGLRALLLSAPVAALVAWSASLQLAQMAATPTGGAGFTATSLSGWQYFLTQLQVQWLYVRLLAWPRGFSIDRPFEASRTLDPAVAVAGLGVLLLVAFALWMWSRAERGGRDAPALRPAAFGILFWFVVLSPTSSVVPVMDLAVEHRVYLASLGLFLAAAVAVDALLHGRLAPRPARIAALAVSLSVVLGLGLSLRARAVTWSSSTGIWEEAYALQPGSERIVANLALALRRAGDLVGAEARFREAWAIVRTPHGIVSVAQNYGGLLVDLDRPGEALEVMDRALPYAPQEPGLRSNRATALGMLGRNEEAVADARTAASVHPENPQFRNMLGVALCSTGDWRAALVEFRAAEALDPGNPIYPVTAAIALTLIGRRDEACATYRRARATTRFLPLPRNAAEAAAALGCPIP
jgi:Flp pilus assembly protein TadD